MGDGAGCGSAGGSAWLAFAGGGVQGAAGIAGPVAAWAGWTHQGDVDG